MAAFLNHVLWDILHIMVCPMKAMDGPINGDFCMIFCMIPEVNSFGPAAAGKTFPKARAVLITSLPYCLVAQNGKPHIFHDRGRCN